MAVTSTTAEPVTATESGPVLGFEVATRYHHLDAVRAFALLLGVFFHAAESFGPNNHYWAIVDCSPSQALEDIRFACHSWDPSGAKMTGVDAWFRAVLRWPGAFYCFLLPTIPMLLGMDSWGVDTPKESLLPHIPTTALFGYFFLAGWLWHRQPGLLANIARRWPWHLGIGVLAWLGFGFVEGNIGRVAFTFLYAHMMWGFVLGFLGMFTRFCQGGNAWTRYVADASYWIYIMHLPLVVAFQVAVGRVAVPWPVKYPIICALALALLFLSYHYLVRGTFIGAYLNGRRFPRQWPWQARADQAVN
jgi:peptidoglycan/LPS O-acetylase OafA/YrhL